MKNLGRIIYLLAFSLAWSAWAATPVEIPPRHYYGPLRICDRAYAFDARDGEGVTHSRGHVLRANNYYISIERGSGFVESPFKDFVRPLGELEVPDSGTFRRVEELSSTKRIHYIYETGEREGKVKLQITSDIFDGSERDAALLGRIIFGTRAAAMCAEIPEHLRPGPERENPRAAWLSPIGRDGPMNYCMSTVTLALQKGERAFLPWLTDWDILEVARGPLVVKIAGRLRLPRDSIGNAIAEGPLAVHPQFAVRELPQGKAYQYLPFLLREPGTRYVNLLRKTDIAISDFGRAPAITLGFSGGWSAEQIAELVGRVRARNDGDSCFGARPK